ncbi:methyl-accepting chemotaxis protein [Methylobacterium oryzihabitans]|uniref:Methyl-accepting chemotaxis protein n=1 Tax=Methylobacterium oryzihabitans TaxID=2499852 RepID=A0A437NXE2_9HYPH|nr:methyl-accepting chemotaxis protein [Methylobacterium oryzihabitans]RVU14663.1 methyl-accepting chemotaxis protein [Methylobacterium oryzihabitans]
MLFRASPSPDRNAEVEILPPEAPRPRAGTVRSAFPAVETVEADLSAAMAVLGTRDREVAGGLGDLRRRLAGLDSALAEAGDEAAAARGRGLRLAEGAGALAGEAESLARVLAQAGRHLDQAGEGGEETRSRLAELEGACADLDGVVAAMEAAARQTHRLAVTALIEAARLGTDGGGIARLADDIRAVSAESSRRAEAARRTAGRLRHGVDATARSVGLAIGPVDRLRPAVATFHRAADEQAGAVRDLAAEARTLSDALDGDRHRRLAALLRETDAACRDLAGTATGAGIAQAGRIAAALRQSEIGDRRVHDRYPVDWLARVGNWGLGRVRDVGRGGLLLEPPEGCGASPGTVLALDLRGLGPARVAVVGRSPRGLHCAFPEADPPVWLPTVLARIAEEHAPFVAAAREMAETVGRALEDAVSAGRLAAGALFAPDYRPVPGTTPPQYRSAASDVLDAAPPSLPDEPGIVAVRVIDRQGHALRPDRRFHDDAAGLAAARSARAFLVQALPPEGAGRLAPLRAVSAPVRVRGRHWGAVRIVCRPGAAGAAHTIAD